MYENKKLSKIVDEVLTYLLDKNATDINVKIERMEKYTSIKTRSLNVDISERELKDLWNYLNSTHREVEMEEYYWSLAGEGSASDELGLVAIMVDIAEVYYEGNEFRMDFFRKNLNNVGDFS